MAVVRPGSGADAMRACVRARAGSKPAREPSRAMGQAGSARDGEPRFRARDPHVRRRPIVARHEGVRTQRPVRAALTGFFSAPEPPSPQPASSKPRRSRTTSPAASSWFC